MAARHARDLDVLFQEAMNAGDLDKLLALYEPGATFTPQPGQVVTGSAAIRDALTGFLGLKPTITLDTKMLGETGDLALMTSRWRVTGTGPDGSPVELTGQSIEVARRQNDGTWRFAIDSPFGLEG